MNPVPRPPIGGLRVPLYVMQMGWHRWGPQAKVRWLHKLIAACEQTITDCEAALDQFRPEDDSWA